MTRKKSIYTLASVYIGTVIGAGFASGQEIIQFFGKHQKLGILGMFLATILFMLLGLWILTMVYDKRIKDFAHLIDLHLGNNKSLGMNLLLAVVLLISYYVMVAGGGAIIEAYFSVSNIYGVLLMTALCYFTFCYGMNGIAKANRFIVPILIILVILFFILTLNQNTYYFRELLKEPVGLKENLLKGKWSWEKIYNVAGWAWSAILYVGFNSLSAMVMMAGLRPFIYDKKAARLGGILGGLGLGLMAMAILLCLMSDYSTVYQLEVPMMAVAQRLGGGFKKTYSLFLWISMYTTAIATGFGAIQNFTLIFHLPKGLTRTVVVLLGIPFALFGFKKLIMIFYPFFGYLGILLLMVLGLKGKIRI